MNERNIFIGALQTEDAAARRAYLEEACGGDVALRERVEGLLKLHEQAGSFLDKPACDLSGTLDTDGGPLSDSACSAAGTATQVVEGPGTRIGLYRLLHKLGAGGMGTVWVAEQTEPVKRQVALKLIKAGMDSGQVIRRFEQERQALALMDHSNIAKVLDAGATGEPAALAAGWEENPAAHAAGSPGRLYFVMELVKGLPITTFCDEHRLTPRQRLELFVPVCHAIQHAHQKGIIHRDIKPSNVLVAMQDGKPVAKVIDFGVAKALYLPLTEQAVNTEFGQVIGTVEYMSPEQAELNPLDIDTRADVYALGVLLYELLTGTTPLGRQRLTTTPIWQLLRLIREEEPLRPSTRLSSSDTLAAIAAARQTEPAKLTRLVRGELDWIVMKALEKDRNRRYETANGLALDVERYLRDEPVQAGPPGAGYRLRKFVRRHKGKVAAAAAMLALLVAGVVASTWQAVRATRAEGETGQALEQLKISLAAERKAKTQARDALDALTDNVVETMFARQPELGETEKAFLRKVLASYEAITQEMGDTAEAPFLRARGYYKVAHLHALLGEQTKAKAEYRQAVSLLEQLAADFDDVAEYRQKLAASHHSLGITLAELGETAEAETAFRQAIALCKKLAGHPPNVLPHRRELAAIYHDLGFLHLRERKYPDAEEAYRQALELNKKLATESPRYRLALARSRSNLGGVLRERGRYAEAEELFRQALEVQQKQVDEFPAAPGSRRDLAETYNGLGIVLLELGKRAEVEPAFRKSLALHQRLADDFPKVFSYRRDLAAGYNDLGNALRRLRKYAEAEAVYRRSLDLKEKLVTEAGAQPRYREELARGYMGLGHLLRDQKKYAEAETAYRQALAHRTQLAEQSPKAAKYQLDRADSQFQLGQLFRLQHRLDEALPWYDQALALVQPLHQHQPNDVATRDLLGHTHWDRARILDALKRPAEGLADWDRAVELAPPAARPGVQLERARAWVRAGKTAEAVADAEALTKDPATPSPMLCNAADVCSLASTAARGATQREAYAGQALALLRRAQAAGFFKDHARIEHLKKDTDLKPLRQREDFQQFVAELEAALKP